MARAVIRVGVDWPVDDLELVDQAAKELGESRAEFIRNATNSRTQNYFLVGGTKHEPAEVETPVFAREQAD